MADAADRANVHDSGHDKRHLLVWTNFPEDGEAAFNEWYDREHIRDRVEGVPGFLLARRFVALEGGPKYLAFYTVAGADVFRSEAYLALRRDPDPRSRSFIPRFTDTLRSVARLEAEIGSGEGAFIAVAAFIAPTDKQAFQARARHWMQQYASLPGIVRLRLLRTDADLVNENRERMEQSERTRLRPPDRIPDWLLMAEADSEEALRQLDLSNVCPDLAGEGRPLAFAVSRQCTRLASSDRTRRSSRLAIDTHVPE